MKYLITGITGFAGPHLANLLYKEGHEVYGLIRRSNGMESDILDTVSQECFNAIKFFNADLLNKDAQSEVFAENRFDGVFHLAAQSHPPTSLLDPLDTMRTNVTGTLNLIHAIEVYQDKCKLMFCSTSEVYGNSGKDGGLLLETDMLAPSNPYAVSKAAMDLYMQERMMNSCITGFITRAFSHTGVRRGRNFSISADAYQIARIMKGLQEPVIEVGNLDTVRVVLDVEDVVRAYYLLMENEGSNGKIFNVCGDTPREMRHFTDVLINISGKTIKKEISERYFRKIDILYQHGSTDTLKKLTGWEPEINISTTLHKLLDYWYQKIKE